MGSPLAPVLAGIFMVELERSIVPTLSEYVSFWKRYVDDTICFGKRRLPRSCLSCLNSFHPSIQFTYESERENKIPFLDVMFNES